MALKLKNRRQAPRKVLFYGKDGTGKSTRACQYVKVKNLKAIVIDVDETNFTECDVLDVEFHTPTQAYKNMLEAIKAIKESEEYDTIVIDGITSWIQYITPKKDPFMALRNARFNEFAKELRNSRLNVILIGQVDMYVEDPGKEEKNNKMVVFLNGWVNEKDYCVRTGDNPENYKYKCITEKQREIK